MTAAFYWTLAPAATVNGAARAPDMPGELYPAEAAALAQLRHPQRRAEWLLSRWLVRRLAQVVVPMTGKVAVLSESGGAPYLAAEDGQVLPGCLTISHKAGAALCAWTGKPGVRIGADLEKVTPRAVSIFAGYFNDVELAYAADQAEGERNTWTSLVWSVKESAIKALRSPVPVDPLRIVLEPLPAGLPRAERGWAALVLRVDGQSAGWQAWCRLSGSWVISLVAHALGEPGGALDAPLYLDVISGETRGEPPSLGE